MGLHFCIWYTTAPIYTPDGQGLSRSFDALSSLSQAEERGGFDVLFKDEAGEIENLLRLVDDGRIAGGDDAPEPHEDLFGNFHGLRIAGESFL